MTEPSVTYPQTLLPSRLAAGEEYASVTAILECDDLPQATLHIPHWRVAGVPVAVRVRALSLEERERVQAAKTVTDQYCLTWQLGCIMPAFTQEQAEALRRKNPHAVEQGALFMWTLSAMDQEWIAHAIETQTGAEPEPTNDAASQAADTVPTPRVRRVA